MKEYIKKNGAWLAFFILVGLVTFLTEGAFLAPRNLTNLLRQSSINGILAAGMTLVILTGGIDLSIGSVVALSGIAAGISQVYWGWADFGVMGAFGSFALSVLVGTSVGLVTGGLISIFGIPPFVITLGVMVIARGLALIFSKGSGISPMGDYLRPLGEEYLSQSLTIAAIALLIGMVLFQNRKNLINGFFPIVTFVTFSYAFLSYKGFPVPVVFLALVLGFVAFLLKNTTLGRSVYAVGSNEQAAHWAGVSVFKVKWFVYAAMGVLAGLSGVLLSARLNGAVPTAGQLFELDAIAAVVIGGTSLKGGVGSVMGSLIGALTIATLDNGMDLLQVDSFYQMVLKGLVIITAVSLDRSQRATL